VLGLCRTGSGALVEGVDKSFMGLIGLKMGIVVGLGPRDERARAKSPSSASALIGITGLSVGVLVTFFRCFACLE
jgi:hypothetical protein